MKIKLELKESETVTEINLAKEEILNDYLLAHISRNLSLLGRKEVLNGRAKFGVFGDGKELAQIAYAKHFKNGDWRSGYYRDQTFMLAANLFTPEEFFFQLYGDLHPELHTHSAGRSFNNHFATHSLNSDGSWKDLMIQKNSSADISPTAGQMPRMLGLGLASKLYKHNKEFTKNKGFTNNGNEVVFGMIGDASTSEGHFFEVLNAAGVLQIPVAIAVWDDGYGISVPKEKQTVKASISEALKGFEKTGDSNGIKIYKARGWNYPELIKVFRDGIKTCRNNHIPVVFHIDEMNQPTGHTTSGSHERYKSEERLQWEQDFDPLKKMREWLISSKISDPAELDEIEKKAVERVEKAKTTAWKEYLSPILKERNELIAIVEQKNCKCEEENELKIKAIINGLKKIDYPVRRDLISCAKNISRYICNNCKNNQTLKNQLNNWLNKYYLDHIEDYSDCVYNETRFSAINIKGTQPVYSESSPVLHGREILKENFDSLLERYPTMLAFGEDVGKIGGVNQCFEGLQNKYGEHRVFDTGIRETSIIGKGIGLALRGFRPIAEIQYFDYLLYALQTLSDDLATLHWRTRGRQVAPLIVRTRGHRLEGIWHAGSPMSMVLGALRGIYICTPRNMTQAAGFYNTLMEGQDPALIIEPLNAYRFNEKRPDNLAEYKVALGTPEIMSEGGDITVVTYGSCVKIALEAVKQLREFKIYAELIDVQTLIPFDLHNTIAGSVKKTRKILFFDEDVPGGATAYMMQKAFDEQKIFSYLDYPPQTLTAREHRPAYGTDGDYFSKPNADNVFERVYRIFHEVNPQVYPKI